MRWWWDYEKLSQFLWFTQSQKHPDISSCIDLILTNKGKSFQSICALEAGSSDCCRMTICIFANYHKLLAIEVLKNLKIRGSWTLYNQLLEVKITTMLKILTYFLTFVRRYLTTMRREKKYIYGNNKPINQSFPRRFSSFYFYQVDRNTVLKEVKKWNMNEAVQDEDILVKIWKKKVEYFDEYICLNLTKHMYFKISSIFQIC